MIKKDTVLYNAQTDEEKILLSRLFDNYVRSSLKNFNTYSDFYGEEKAQLIENAFSTQQDVKMVSWGGYEGAERVILSFLANEENESFPITCLEITGRDIDKLSHRDFLGSLMGLGIKRETVGDILISDKCHVFVKEEIADYIIYNLTKIGNKGVSVSVFEGEISSGEERCEIISATVESLRLDLIVSRGFNIKRSEAISYISGGRVTAGGRVVTAKDYRVKENEKITLKGKGKLVFLEENGLSKKGKIIVSIKKYM